MTLTLYALTPQNADECLQPRKCQRMKQLTNCLSMCNHFVGLAFHA